MDNIIALVVSNSLIAAVLAIVALLASRWCRHPQVSHALWLLVLAKFVTPPVIDLPVPNLVTFTDSHHDRAVLRRETERLPNQWSVVIDTDQAGIASDQSDDPHVDEELPLRLLDVDFVTGPPAQAAGFDVTGREHGPVSGPHVVVEPRLMVTEGSKISNETGGILEHTVPGRDAAASVPPALPARWPSWKFRILPILMTFWITGTGIYVALLIRQCMRFQALIGMAKDADDRFQDDAKQLSGRLGLSRCPPVVVVDARVPPLVWAAVARPIVVLPQSLLTSLDRRQQQAVLMHELAHIRRRDHLVRWLEAVVLSLFWWNPLPWWARTRLRQAEEECCDAWVVWALPEGRHDYGQALLQTVEFLTEPAGIPAVAGTAFGGSEVKRRIEMILKRNMNRTMSRSSWVAVLLIWAAALPVAGQVADDSDPASDPNLQAQPAAGIGDESPRAVDPADAPAPAEPAATEQPGAGADDNTSGLYDTRLRAFVRATQPAATPAATDGAFADAPPPRPANFEARLQRLEQMVEKLARSQAATRPSGTGTALLDPAANVSQEHRAAQQAFDNARKRGLVASEQQRKLVAISPDGRYVATLTAGSRKSDVELFDTPSGRLLSRHSVSDNATGIRFEKDRPELIIVAPNVEHRIGVPDGRLIRRYVARDPNVAQNATDPRADAVNRGLAFLRARSESKSILAQQALEAATEELEAKIRAHEAAQKELEQQLDALTGQQRLLDVEVKLEQNNLARAEAELKALSQTDAAEIEVQKQKLAVQEARLKLERARAAMELEAVRLEAAENKASQARAQVRESIEAFLKRHPNHPKAQTYRNRVK